MNSDTGVTVKPELRIGDVCALTGATPRMIRHYEKTGILLPGRESNGYRVFTDEDVAVIRDARCLIAAGLSAAETAALVHSVCGDDAVPVAELDSALDRIAGRRALLDQQIGRLVSARDKLDELRDEVEFARRGR